MSDPLIDTLNRLLKHNRAADRETSRFQTLKHDAHLLPKFQTQLEALLTAHEKYRDVIYNTQGILDDGSDLVLRIPAETTSEVKLVCFQVKSHGDILNPTFMQALKAQHSDTIRKVVGLEHYYIVLCTDVAKHRKKISAVMAEFRSDGVTEVIEPGYALTFLSHPVTRIDAFSKRVIEAKDKVYRNALEELGGIATITSRALVVHLAVRALDGGRNLFQTEDLLQDRDLENIYEDLRTRYENQLAAAEAPADDDFESDEAVHEDDQEDWDDDEYDDDDESIGEFQDQLAIDLDHLDSVAVQRNDNNSVTFNPAELKGLRAVITDAIARYEYTGTRLLDYMFDVMGIRD